jgi:hypothetical protein
VGRKGGNEKEKEKKKKRAIQLSRASNGNVDDRPEKFNIF